MSFNPILEVRQLRRIRFSVRDLRPTLNTALVLTADGTLPLTVRAGEQIPGARTANYREVYVVDIGERSLRMSCTLPTRDGLSFQAAVTYACQVVEPELVVRNRIHDVEEALRPLIVRELRRVSLGFPAADMGQAEQALDDRLLGHSPDGMGIAVRRCTVELSLDRDVERAIRSKYNTTASLETDKLRTDAIMQYVESGDPGLIAMYLNKNPGQAGAVFELLLAHDHERGAQMIEAIKTAMHGRSPDDDFAIEEARTRMIDRAVEGLSSRPAGRESRLRGSLLRSEEPREIAPPAPAPEPSPADDLYTDPDKD